MLIWLFHNRPIITAGTTGGLAILALALLLMAPRAAFAAWPVDIVAGGFAPISGYPDMPEILDAGTRYFEIANRCDFILLERMEGQTVNRVEYRDLAFSLHTTSADMNWGFYLSYERLNGNAYFLSDGLVDGFDILPKQWAVGVCKRINPDWLLACVAKRQRGAAPASIDSLVTNLSRFEPGDSTGSVRSSIDGFEAQIRNKKAEGEAFTLSLGYDDLSAAMGITSPDESLDIALPLSGWHFATGYEKDTGEKAFKTGFEWSSLGGVGRIMFNDELDLGPVHNGYRNTELAFNWRIGREDDDADYFGLRLNRNRLSSYGSADAVIFGGPIFGIISGRGHYNGAIKIDNLAVHYAHRWRVGDSTRISTGIQIIPYRLNGSLTTYESAYFGTKIIDEQTSRLDVRGGILGSLGLGLSWDIVDDVILSANACQLIPLHTRAIDAEPSPGPAKSVKGGTLVSLRVCYVF